jgi:esterase/lipase superfamily enzyme
MQDTFQVAMQCGQGAAQDVDILCHLMGTWSSAMFEQLHEISSQASRCKTCTALLLNVNMMQAKDASRPAQRRFLGI